LGKKTLPKGVIEKNTYPKKEINSVYPSKIPATLVMENLCDFASDAD